MVEAIVAAERNIAHRIIEEFMLLANETVAQHLDDHDVPTLYRIHEQPDPLKVEEFEEFVVDARLQPRRAARRTSSRGIFRSWSSGSRERRRKSRSRSSCCGRCRRRATTRQNLGHFGLAAESYTHFTSPIRRYPGPGRPPHAARVAAGR